MRPRQATKRILERLLRIVRGDPRRMAGRSLILAYHNVVPDGLQSQGDQSLHLPLSAFLRQIDLITAHCRVLSLTDLLAEGPFNDGPHVAITFDDAYLGAVELAFPELARRGLPSTLFVAPGLLGGRSFWWDELAGGPGGLPEDLRRSALEAEAGRYEWIRSRLLLNADSGPLPSCFACASEQQLRALGELGGVTFGAHSWSHPNLVRIRPDELALELERPLEWLRTSGIPMVPILAYPYGLASKTVVSAAEQAGYTAALLVAGGWLGTRARHPWAIPRYNVPAGLSDDGLMLRLAGVVAAR